MSDWNFSVLKKSKGLIFLTEPKTDFVDQYLALRAKESRVLSDAMVKQLPYIEPKEKHHSEWLLRQKSTERFVNYLNRNFKKKVHILDIGCGNGWFSNILAAGNTHYHVLALDVNQVELEQAARIFKKPNLQFACADIFEAQKEFVNRFDIIVLNASAQYFPNFSTLVSVLKTLLREKGEIHIIDSPFYAEKEIRNAQKRSEDYYTKMGFPAMAKSYHHHALHELQEFDVLYKPKNKLLMKFYPRKDSPFMWLRLIKTHE